VPVASGLGICLLPLEFGEVLRGRRDFHIQLRLLERQLQALSERSCIAQHRVRPEQARYTGTGSLDDDDNFVGVEELVVVGVVPDADVLEPTSPASRTSRRRFA
jgi:hypothetical protein